MTRQEIYEHYMKHITNFFSQIGTVDRNTFMNYISDVMRIQYVEIFNVFKERNMLDEDEIENEELYKTEKFYVIRQHNNYTPLFLLTYPRLWDIFTNCLYDMKANQQKYREIIEGLMCKDKNGEELYKVCDKYDQCEVGSCDNCYQLDRYSDQAPKINFTREFLDNEVLANNCFSSKEKDFGEGKSLFNLVLDDDSYLSGKMVLSVIKYNIDIELNSLQLIHTSYENFPYLFIMIAELWNQIEEYKNTEYYRTSVLKKICYKIGWIFSNTSPFYRGSASFSKIIMNACLIKSGFSPVKETSIYHGQTDWISLLSPNFDSYYAKVIAWQVFEELDQHNQHNQHNKHNKHNKYNKHNKDDKDFR